MSAKRTTAFVDQTPVWSTPLLPDCAWWCYGSTSFRYGGSDGSTPSERLKEIFMEQDLTDKRRYVLTRGRGVTAAQRAFNSSGGGSNPFGPNRNITGSRC